VSLDYRADVLIPANLPSPDSLRKSALQDGRFFLFDAGTSGALIAKKTAEFHNSEAQE